MIQLPLIRLDITNLTVIPSDVNLAVVTTSLSQSDDDVGFIKDYLQQWPVIQQLMSGIRSLDRQLLEEQCEENCKQGCPPSISCIPVVKTKKEVEYYKPCNCRNQTCRRSDYVSFGQKRDDCGFVTCEKNIALGYRNRYYQFAYKNICFYWDCLYRTILFERFNQ